MIPVEKIMEVTIASARNIKHPRFYKSERGYQGEFLSNLRFEFGDLSSYGLILEQECQKRITSHGTKQRPDIILHVPAIDGESVNVRSVAVWALKLNASVQNAKDDFSKLDIMIETLGYSLGIFVNINNGITHACSYSGKYHEKVHMISVAAQNGEVSLKHEKPTIL